MKDDSGRDLRCENEGKICYTKREAGNALNGAKKCGCRAKNMPKRSYYCEECGCYHLTHYSFYKSNKAQRKFKQKLREIIDFENERAWREEYSSLSAA